jgi:hydroxylamine reductase
MKPAASSLKIKPGLRSFAAQPALETDMFCYQCEQTQDNKGCTTIGVCGKTPEVAGLQDLLVYSLKGLGSWAHLAGQNGIKIPQEIQSFITGATFSTLTNVNFDEARFVTMLQQAADYEAQLKKMLKDKRVATPAIPKAQVLGWTGDLPHPMTYNYPGASDMDLLRHQAKQAGVALRRESLGETLAGLQEMLMYGLKGMCAYTHHAEALGATDPQVYSFVNEAYSFLGSPQSKEPAAVLDMCMKLGAANLKTMEVLSNGHAHRFGKPTPTPVSLDPVEGKAILVTGHDMHDLECLLKQTEGKGVNVYTHGEMLPAHGYPGLKKYKHLVGHFGGAWYRQKIDFSAFPGAVLATTNCVLDPPKAYKNRLFTTNETGLAGVTHIGTDKDFTPLIQAALAEEGFNEDNMPDAEELAAERAEEGKLGVVTVGFGHDVVLSVADQVVDAIKGGKLEHIFVIGGCDGSEPQRKYYDKLARLMPQNTMVLTLGCGKYRIFDQDFGNLPGTGLPRLLDMGQCNDAYSALVVATALAKEFKTDVNGLPLSLDISWFEQKAVAVLLTMLHLGVKNIRLGPRMPGFLTPDAVKQLVAAFEIKPANTEDPATDLKNMMASH